MICSLQAILCSHSLSLCNHGRLFQNQEFIDLLIMVGGESDFGSERRTIGMHRIAAALFSPKLKSMLDRQSQQQTSDMDQGRQGPSSQSGKRGAEATQGQMSPIKRACLDGRTERQHLCESRAQDEGENVSSIFLDGKLGLPCYGNMGDSGVDNMDLAGGGPAQGMIGAQAGQKMLRILESDGSAGLDGASLFEFQVIELVTSMSCTGELEYYEWLPANRLSSINNVELESQIQSWTAQQRPSLNGSAGGGEQPRRYFKNPIKKRIKGCRSSRENKRRDGSQTEACDYWSVNDVLFEIDEHVLEQQFQPSSGQPVRYLDIKDEAKVLQHAENFRRDCISGMRINLMDNFLIFGRGPGHSVIQVTSILAAFGSNDEHCSIAMVKDDGEQVGMCRPYCCPTLPSAESHTSRVSASRYIIRGRQYEKVDRATRESKNEEMYSCDPAGEVKSFNLTDVAGALVTRKKRPGQPSAEKDGNLSYITVKSADIAKTLSARGANGSAPPQQLPSRAGMANHAVARKKPSATQKNVDIDLTCPYCGRMFVKHSGGRKAHIKKCEKTRPPVSNHSGRTAKQAASSPQKERGGMGTSKGVNGGAGYIDGHAGVPFLYESHFGNSDGLDGESLQLSTRAGEDRPDDIDLNLSHAHSESLSTHASVERAQSDAFQMRTSPYRAASSEADVQAAAAASGSTYESDSAGQPVSARQAACQNNDVADGNVSGTGNGPMQLLLPTLHPDAVQAILEFCYTGKTTIFGTHSLLALAAAVHELQVDSMIDDVSKLIQDSINAETCVPILQKTPRSWQKPFSLAFRFALSKFDLVARSSTFLAIDELRLQELLKHDGLCVSSEYDLYQHLLRWMCSDHPELDTEVDGFFVQPRTEGFGGAGRHGAKAIRGKELLHYIRYPLMDVKRIVNDVFRDKRLMIGADNFEFWQEVSTPCVLHLHGSWFCVYTRVKHARTFCCLYCFCGLLMPLFYRFNRWSKKLCSGT